MENEKQKVASPLSPVQCEYPHYDSDGGARTRQRHAPLCFPIPDRGSKRERPEQFSFDKENSNSARIHQAFKRQRCDWYRPPRKEVPVVSEWSEKRHPETSVGHRVKKSMRGCH